MPATLTPPVKPKRVKRFTGQIMKRVRPNIYRQVVDGLSQGISANQLSKLHRVSRATIAAVQREESRSIAEKKDRLIHKLFYISDQSTDRILSTIGSASLKDAAITTGISIEKAMLLLGEAPGAQVNVQVNVTELRERAQKLWDQMEQAPPGGGTALPPSP